jgi:SAM-dependent methyltransferase
VHLDFLARQKAMIGNQPKVSLYDYSRAGAVGEFMNSGAFPRVSAELADLYEDCYAGGGFDETMRSLAARDSVEAIVQLGESDLGRTVDVGAGDGAVSAEIDRRRLATDIVALEISRSGAERIRQRKLPSLSGVELFDGYTIPAAAKSFDTAVCAHVIEHVEHERLLLREIGRVARRLYLVAPLEGGARGRVCREGGHINYYSPMTLVNLIETSGFKVTRSCIFAPSTAFEQHMSGPVMGFVKNSIRRSLRVLLGRNAPHVMTYWMAVEAEPYTTGNQIPRHPQR